MADDYMFNLDTVRDFMIERGGKVKNHELVTHFKSFLNDPIHRVKNREKFKDFVNTLATIKLDENGEKVLVLKKKYRDTGGPIQHYKSGASDSSTSKQHTQGGEPTRKAQKKEPSPPKENEPPPRPPPPQVAEPEPAPPVPHASSVPEEPIEEPDPPLQKVEGHVPPLESVVDQEKAKSRESMPEEAVPVAPPAPVKESITTEQSVSKEGKPEDTENKEKAEPKTPGEGQEEEDEVAADVSVVSVKERAKHLNRMSSETDMVKDPAKTNGAKSNKTTGGEGKEDEDSQSGSSVAVTLDQTEREWMIIAATADYHPLYKLLSKNPHLARRKDFTSTALHWAAKHGKIEVVKLLCGTQGVLVNCRSGYTPLHLAAMHGHEDIIELLVQTYNADANIRDYSGKKAKQYLRNSASTRAQQLLAARRLSSQNPTTTAGPFKRQGSYSSKIRSSGFFGINPNIAMRHSWTTSAALDQAADRGKSSRSSSRSTSPSPRASPRTSPSLNRKSSLHGEKESMPPPKGVPMRKKKSKKNKDTGSYSDSEMPRSESEPVLRDGARLQGGTYV